MASPATCPLLGHRASAHPESKDAAGYDCPECGKFTVTQRLWRLIHAYPERLRRAVSLYIQEQSRAHKQVLLDVDNFQSIGEGYLHRI